jgi:hypothetical protein
VAVVAVAIVATALEVSDYCDEQGELHGESNVLYGTDIAFDTKGCLEASKDDARAIWEEVKKSSTSGLTSALEESSRFTDNVTERIRKALTSAGGTASEVWAQVRLWLRK